MSKRAIVTGASGFLGRQVLQIFKESGWNVVGTGYTRPSPPSIVRVDLSDSKAVTSLLDEFK